MNETLSRVGSCTKWVDRCHFGDCRETMRAMIADGVKASESDLAYCAGVIDSDGTIGVKKSSYGQRVVGDRRAPGYSERICVKQVERGAVDLLKQLFGGTFYMEQPQAKARRHLYVWQVTDRNAVICLSAILPYLRIKRLQAENCLALRAVKAESAALRVAPGRGHAGSAPRTVEHGDAMEKAYLIGKELNRVGA